MAADANLDARGIRRRLGLGVLFLAAGLGAAAWLIHDGASSGLRIGVSAVLFLVGSLSLLQAREKV